MNPEEFVFITIWVVLGMVMLRYLLTAIFGAERMGVGKKRRRADPADDAEVNALKQQVAALTDRVKVLERITVEEGSSLAAEIERLREPEQLGYGDADDLTELSRPRNRV